MKLLQSTFQKRVVSIIILLVLLFHFTAPALADGNGSEPSYQTVCGNLPYHRMVAKAWGRGYVNDTPYTSPNAWQCSNCYLVMVTEGDIVLGEMQPIGKWVTASWIEPITSMAVHVYAEHWGICNSSSMSGYRFFLSSLF